MIPLKYHRGILAAVKMCSVSLPSRYKAVPHRDRQVYSVSDVD